MSRHRIANRAKATRARAAYRRRRISLHESVVTGWLGAGVLTLGMGAAVLAGGSGVAYADGSNDAATTNAAADSDDAADAPRSKASNARSAGSARAVSHTNSSVRRGSDGASRPDSSTPTGGVVRSAAAVNTSRHLVVPSAGADTDSAAPSAVASTIRPPLNRSAPEATRQTATVTPVAAAAAIRQSPVQQVVGVVVNALVALGGMDPVTPEPARGNLWQLGLYSVARWLADTANPGGIPKVQTTSIGAPDPETGVVAGRVLFTTASGAPVTYRVSTDPTQGTATINPDGSYSYTPLQSTRLGAPEGGAPVTMALTVYNGVQKSTTNFKFNINPWNFIKVTIPVGDYPTGLALSPTGDKLVVLTPGSDAISVISTATNQVINNIGGLRPYSGAFTPDGSAVYVFSSDGSVSSVSRVSLLNNAVIDTDFTSNTAGFVAIGPANTPAAGRLYVSGEGEVSLIATNTNTVLPGTISVGQGPLDLAVSSDGQRVFVANALDKTVSVINTATNTVIATVPIADPSSLGVTTVAVTPDGELVYVVGVTSNNVWVIDTATNTVSAPISVSNGPIGRVAVSPDGSVVYVTNLGSNTVSAISTVTNTVIKTISVGNGPIGVAVSSSRLYVTNSGDDTVTVVGAI